MIHETAIVYPGVTLGDAARIGAYCLVGVRPDSIPEGTETVIGDDALIRASTIIYAGNRIGRGFRTGDKANIRENNTIGDDVSIGTLTVIEHHVIIEDGVRIHSQAFVPEYSVLKRGAWVGPNAVLTNARYPLSPDAKEQLQGPVLGERAIVGANATLLPGVRIGARSLVGAGSVVTKDVPEGTVVAGVPAEVIGEVDY